MSVFKLTAAIMMALSRKPNPTKGMALWNNTENEGTEMSAFPLNGMPI